MKSWLIWAICFCLFNLSSKAQDLIPPLKIPLRLSGNFGELRSNHFHSGVDFKTEQVINKPVYAINEGFISRIVIGPFGYGKALYVDHPDGLTSVYAHLNQFSPAIESYIYKCQMEQQSFKIDTIVPPDKLPVQKGEEIARSGNTGSSGGPHLHFELRNTQNEHVIDPLPFYRDLLTDTRAPIVQALSLSPVSQQGVIEGSTASKIYNVTAPSPGNYRLKTPISAWGKLGFALKCYDVMDGTSNIYGVKNIRLFLDSALIFNSSLTEFSFDETRYINSLIDYPKWKRGGGFYQKCYIEPGNKLSFLNSSGNGIVDIKEERDYQLIFELEDDFGNYSQLLVTIRGKQTSLPQDSTDCENTFIWYSSNRFREKGVDLELPKGAIYDSFCFEYYVNEDENPLAGIHFLHNDETPLHSYSRLTIHLNKDSLQDKSKYGIVQYSSKGNRWIGGSYKKGWIEGKIREFGTYTVSIDTVRPKIIPIGGPLQWKKKGIVELRLSDNMSGIESFKTYIDNEFVLFEPDKKSVIRKNLSNLPHKESPYELTIEVTDKCGNISYYKESFNW